MPGMAQPGSPTHTHCGDRHPRGLKAFSQLSGEKALFVLVLMRTNKTVATQVSTSAQMESHLNACRGLFFFLLS